MKTKMQIEQLTGVVVKKTGALCRVRLNETTIPCTIANQLQRLESKVDSHHSMKGRKRAFSHAESFDPVAVGDIVKLRIDQEGAGCIVEILPRRNQLSRPTAVPMPGAHAFEQVFASNVDLLVPIFSVSCPPPKWNMLDRYLVCAEAAGVDILICITKCDLLKDSPDSGELLAEVEQYQRIGYRALFSSAKTGEGYEELKAALHGKVSVLAGKSGVGKTSLLNRLDAGLSLRTNEVSAYNGKGRHTTAHVEMYHLSFGGDLIDTPGVREFGLWNVNREELAGLFPEMRPFLGLCKFGLGCQHDEEPGCSIRKAVMDGHIHPRRYQSYLKLLRELE